MGAGVATESKHTKKEMSASNVAAPPILVCLAMYDGLRQNAGPVRGGGHLPVGHHQ